MRGRKQTVDTRSCVLFKWQVGSIDLAQWRPLWRGEVYPETTVIGRNLWKKTVVVQRKNQLQRPEIGTSWPAQGLKEDGSLYGWDTVRSEGEPCMILVGHNRELLPWVPGLTHSSKSTVNSTIVLILGWKLGPGNMWLLSRETLFSLEPSC